MMLRNTARRLRQRGILGLNQRNRDFVMRYNPRHLYPLVDDKLRTKRLAAEYDVPTPPLFATFENEHQVREIADTLSDIQDFAMKPARGAGGDGILIAMARRGDRFRRAKGNWVGFEDLAYHASNILSGVYSLGGQNDVAMVEHRVQPDSLFEAISFGGVPDVRIIVLKGYPVMAMVRLPTQQSDGKGNLHQGAIGAGIDLETGRTLHGVWGNERTRIHPDTESVLAGVAIPDWEVFLLLAARCYEMTGLGYLGVDIVLDRKLGPLLLELNARPGLNIQIANDAGLATRCKRVEAETAMRAPDQRVAVIREIFGAIHVAHAV
jgi:alpha-L-glutamate ligase-like protein